MDGSITMISARIKYFYALFILGFGVAMEILTFHFLKRPLAVKLGTHIIRNFSFIDVELIGKIDGQADMVLLNHENFIDIGIMETLTKRDIAWVAKEELFHIPFFKYAIALPNNISIARESKSSLLKLLRDVKDRRAHNRLIAIFPEGTRAKNRKMGPFLPGTQFVAKKLQLKVQPIVLISTGKLFNSTTQEYQPGKLFVVALNTKEPPQNNDPQWLETIRQEMIQTYQHYDKKVTL